MKTLILALALGAIATSSVAAEYSVGAGSTLGFTGSFQGENFEGRFGKFEASIRYDAADLAASKFDVTVDLASVATGDSDRDATLPDSDFFDIAKFPQARFVTTGFREAGGGVVADGTLTLKGISKPVSLAVTFTPKGAGATLDVKTTLKRLDFNVGSGDFADTSTIGNEVEVKAHLELAAK